MSDLEGLADIVRQAQWGYITPQGAVKRILEDAQPATLAAVWDEAIAYREANGWTEHNPYRPTP